MTAFAKPDEPVHIGTLIREAREAAGLSRAALEAQTGVQASALKAVEYRRHRLRRSILDRLLVAPAMSGLLARAERMGVKVDLADDQPEQVADPSAQIKDPEATGKQGEDDRGQGEDASAEGDESGPVKESVKP